MTEFNESKPSKVPKLIESSDIPGFEKEKPTFMIGEPVVVHRNVRDSEGNVVKGTVGVEAGWTVKKIDETADTIVVLSPDGAVEKTYSSSKLRKIQELYAGPANVSDVSPQAGYDPTGRFGYAPVGQEGRYNQPPVSPSQDSGRYNNGRVELVAGVPGSAAEAARSVVEVEVSLREQATEDIGREAAADVVDEPIPETEDEMYARFERETQAELSELYRQHRQLDPRSAEAAALVNQIKYAKEDLGKWGSKRRRLRGM
ncbi:MAG: hypothetical protein ACOH18_04860 [Candidatus Saccharimonadaceae bacterium]